MCRSLRLFALSLALASSASAAVVQADRVLVEKAERRLTLYRAGQVLAQYPIALGFNPVGHKQFEGDGRTPEGKYRLSFKNANSRYYKSIRISYPNAADRAYAAGFKRSPGGDIMIHGQRNGLGALSAVTQLRDWTLGCIALTDADMEQLWQRLSVNTPIEIRP